MMQTLGEFLSPEAGQARRKWLDESLGQFIPPELRGWVGAGAELNPVTNMERASIGAKRVADPSLSGWDRMAAAGDTAVNMASVLAPVAGAKLAGTKGADAIVEALTAASPMKGAVDDFMVDEFGGVTLYHGSPKAGLRELIPGPEGTGALGPGVYGSPFRRTAEMYTRDGGDIYQFEAPDDLFLGSSSRWDDIPSNVNSYQVWRDQVARLADANPEQADMIRAAGEKMLYDGYPFFRELANRLGSKEAAQELYKRAGFKGLTAMVDGPEAVLFDAVNLAPSDPIASRGAQIMDMLRSGRAADVTDEMLDMGDATANARLNEWLFNNYDLPMDAASRAARADVLGFDRPAFHETGSDFVAFDLGNIRAAASDSELPRGVFTKPTAKSIGLGGDTEAQMPVQIRSGTSAYYESRPGFVRDFSTDDAYARATTRADAFDNAKNRQFERRFEDDRPGRRSNQWTKEQWAEYDAKVDEYLAKWKAQNAELASRAQREANRVAAERGIDTINIKDDAGSFKRSTETNISLDPANIRSRFARFDPRLAHLRNLSAGLGIPLAAYLGQDPETLGSYLEAQ